MLDARVVEIVQRCAEMSHHVARPRYGVHRRAKVRIIWRARERARAWRKNAHVENWAFYEGKIR